MSGPDPFARLAHDVGKYVARTARNLPADGPVPAVLRDMLLRDLWSLPAGGRASEVFASLSATLPSGADAAPELAEVAAHLTAIDELEAEVRTGDEGALRRAAALALEVEALLRGLARRRAGAGR